MSNNQIDDLIVSYQMGKVGSSSITAKIPGCIQTHSWGGEEPIKYFSSRYTGSLIGRVMQNIRWRYVCQNLQRRVLKTKKIGGKVKLIVGVREPVSRNVSGYFQTLTIREQGKSVKQIVDEFWAFCPHFSSLYWFDVEMKRSIGVDVYKHPFNKSEGYAHIVDEEVDIFIYQLEKLSTLEDKIRKFVGRDDFQLVRENDASDKWLGDVYEGFVKVFKPGEEYLSLMYASKYFEHFYSEEDRKRFVDKWS